MSRLGRHLTRFLAELRRRHVLNVVAGYAIAGWLVAQVADVAFGPLGLGDTAMKVLVITIIAGFPVVIVLAWVFDLTPLGIRRTPTAPPAASSPGSAESHPAHARNRPAAPNTIAVLPFVNMGSEDDEYFCDGLTEEILDALARVPELRVAARTSSFAFKGKDEDIREIGRRLGVARVVEGSVRRSGDRLRVTAQLVGVADGYHVWSHSFDRVVEDVFATQEEISREVVAAMGVGAVDEPGEGPATHRRPQSMEAYRLFLKGRYFWNQRGPGLRKGIEYFERALTEDPAYAPALAGLADCFALLGYYGFLEPMVAFPKARSAAQKALSLDATLGEAQTTMAFVQHFFEWDPALAETTFLRAIQLNPSYAPAHYWYAVLLSSLGRHEEALDRDFRAMEVDPVSPFLSVHHGYTLMQAGRFDDAVAQLDGALLLDPTSLSGAWVMSYAAVAAGQCAKGLAASESVYELSGKAALLLPPLAHAHARCGNPERARELLKELADRSKAEFVWPSHVGIVRAALGDLDAGFSDLERAVEIRDHWITTLQVEPAFAPFRTDPRFDDLMAKVLEARL